MKWKSPWLSSGSFQSLPTMRKRISQFAFLLASQSWQLGHIWHPHGDCCAMKYGLSRHMSRRWGQCWSHVDFSSGHHCSEDAVFRLVECSPLAHCDTGTLGSTAQHRQSISPRLSWQLHRKWVYTCSNHPTSIDQPSNSYEPQQTEEIIACEIQHWSTQVGLRDYICLYHRLYNITCACIQIFSYYGTISLWHML